MKNKKNIFAKLTLLLLIVVLICSCAVSNRGNGIVPKRTDWEPFRNIKITETIIINEKKYTVRDNHDESKALVEKSLGRAVGHALIEGLTLNAFDTSPQKDEIIKVMDKFLNKKNKSCSISKIQRFNEPFGMALGFSVSYICLSPEDIGIGIKEQEKNCIAAYSLARDIREGVNQKMFISLTNMQNSLFLAKPQGYYTSVGPNSYLKNKSTITNKYSRKGEKFLVALLNQCGWPGDL